MNIRFRSLILFLCSCSLLLNECTVKEVEVILTPSQKIADASFRGSSIGDDGSIYVSGSNGSVYSSTDKGANWKACVVPDSDTLDFRDVQVLAKEKVLLMTAGSGTASRIYQSSDAGATWRKVYQNEQPAVFFNGFAFWNENDGVLIGDPDDDSKLYLLITDDGGVTWNRIGAESLPLLTKDEYGFAASGTGIFTKGTSELFIGTGGGSSRIYHSTDKGATWSVYNTPIVQGEPSKGMFSVHFYESGKGIAVGGDYKKDKDKNGNVILSTDNGKSWKLAPGHSNVGFQSCVQKIGNNVLLSTGTSGTYLSKDDGRNWELLSEEGFHTMAISPDGSYGILAGGEGRVATIEVH